MGRSVLEQELYTVETNITNVWDIVTGIQNVPFVFS
jgi:hypothetical protein